MKKLLLLAFIIISPFLFGFNNFEAEFDPLDGYVYINNVESPVPVTQIQQELIVNDPEDGNITEDIYIILDNYTPNKNVIGDFLIVFGVTDSGGIETTVAVTVRNKDATNPKFEVEEASLKIYQGSNIALHMPIVKAIDGYDGDITGSINVTGIDLVDTNTLGFYDLIYTVTDSSGNTASQTITIEIIDGVKPVISGPSEIIKRHDYILPGDFYLDMFSATDNIDGVLSQNIVVVQDDYIGNGDKKGSYQVILEVTDSYGNVATHELTIKVDEDMLAMMIVDQYTFYLSNQDQFLQEHFVSTLKHIDDLPNDNYIFESNNNTYENHYDSTGTYLNVFHLTSETGIEYDRTIKVVVLESDFNLVESSPGFIANVGSHFGTWWWAYGIGVVIFVGLIKKT